MICFGVVTSLLGVGDPHQPMALRRHERRDLPATEGAHCQKAVPQTDRTSNAERLMTHLMSLHGREVVTPLARMLAVRLVRSRPNT